MGKATRWLKGILGMKKDKEKERENLDGSSSVSSDKREKKRFSFAKSRDSNVTPQILENIQAKDASWLKPCLSETENEQTKHAIAVAAATAAAADAAVAAAQAAVAVVRLTSQRRGLVGGKENFAAVKIQTVFRGFLARKALRALKGLVKLQAVVRGYLVRKRAAATLRSMQALIRAQTAVRTQCARRSFEKENRYQLESRPRKSTERFDDTRSEFHSKRQSASHEISGFDDSPKIVEIDTYKPRTRARRFTTALSECSEEFPYNGMSSPFPCPIPSRISFPDSKNQDFDWFFTVDECKSATAQSTPRFASSLLSKAPPTPARSVCGDSYFRPYSNYPNYMANTQSFNAKLRSHSAPKQRPGPGPKKRLTLDEIIASRSSISSVRMQRSCSKVDEDSCF